MNKQNVIIVYHPGYLEHDTGSGHPESPVRLLSIYSYLKKNGWLERIPVHNPQPAPIGAIAAIHDLSYIERTAALCDNGGGILDGGDTVVSSGSYRAALLAAGAGLYAVDKIESGEIRRAFCLVRPPGHHAERDNAMGFCIFNNIAITAQYWINKLQEKKICIVDWDVHHGNGTQDAFYKSADVLYISLHQHPLYPGTGFPEERGMGKGEGYTVNIPLTPGSGDEEYLDIFRSEVIPRIQSYKPRGFLISAGFDAHKMDPLANLSLSKDAYSALTHELMALANETADGKILSYLEGGYNLHVLPECAAAHLEAML